MQAAAASGSACDARNHHHQQQQQEGNEDKDTQRQPKKLKASTRVPRCSHENDLWGHLLHEENTFEHYLRSHEEGEGTTCLGLG